MGGASISEGRLLELLQAVDKYCCWLLSRGTLDLKVWEKVGAELKKKNMQKELCSLFPFGVRGH